MSLSFTIVKKGDVLKELTQKVNTDNWSEYRSTLRTFQNTVNSVLSELINEEKEKMDTNTIEDDLEEGEDDDDEDIDTVISCKKPKTS